MKKNKENSKIYKYLIALLVILIFLSPYFVIFHDGVLSNKTEDWGAFGSYLAGIIGLINLIVFIYISFLINKINKDNNERGITNQKLITLTQFRQDELDKLSNELSKWIENDGSEEINVIISKLAFAQIYLVNFSNQKDYLFPILLENKLRELIVDISNTMTEFGDLVKKFHGQVLSKKDRLENEKKFIKYLNQKSTLLKILQEFIIKELE